MSTVIVINDDHSVTVNGQPVAAALADGGTQKAVVGEPSTQMVSVQGAIPATFAEQVQIYETRGGSGEIEFAVSPDDVGVVTATFGPMGGQNPSDATAYINGVAVPARGAILKGMEAIAINTTATDTAYSMRGSFKVKIVGHTPGAESRVQFTRQP